MQKSPLFPWEQPVRLGPAIVRLYTLRYLRYEQAEGCSSAKDSGGVADSDHVVHEGWIRCGMILKLRRVLAHGGLSLHRPLRPGSRRRYGILPLFSQLFERAPLISLSSPQLKEGKKEPERTSERGRS